MLFKDILNRIADLECEVKKLQTELQHTQEFIQTLIVSLLIGSLGVCGGLLVLVATGRDTKVSHLGRSDSQLNYYRLQLPNRSTS